MQGSKTNSSQHPNVLTSLPPSLPLRPARDRKHHVGRGIAQFGKKCPINHWHAIFLLFF